MTATVAIGAPQGMELVILLLIILLIFGAKRLPEIGRGLGRGIKEFREGTKGLADDLKEGIADDRGEAATGPRSVGERSPSERPQDPQRPEGV